MAYQPTNNIFLSHQTSQRYFQPWLISQTSPNEQGDYHFLLFILSHALPPLDWPMDTHVSHE